MVAGDKVGRVADGAAKLDGLEWVGVVEGNEFGDKIRSLRLQPEMEQQIASIKGAASVHQTAKLDERRRSAEIESDMGQAVINSDGHGRKRGGWRWQVGLKRCDVEKAEAGFLQSRWWRRGKWRRCRWKGGKVGGGHSGGSKRRRRDRSGNKRLGRRNAGCRQWKNFVGQRGAFAKMRLVGKEIRIKDSGSTRGTVIRTLTEDMVGVAAVHAPSEPQRIGTLKVGCWVDWETRRGRWRRALITMHRFLRG